MHHNDAKRPARSDGEIERFVRAFHYEAEMLLSQGLLYLDHGREIADDRSEGKQVVADALLDSLLNRLRAFDEFFGSRKTRFDTDARASDSALTDKWELPHTLDCETRNRISRRLSHLTYDRPPEHVWHIGIMIRKAIEAISDFMSATHVDDGNWDDLRESVKRTLADWDNRDWVQTSRDRGHAFRA